jgi:hypothetical protein
MWHLRKSTTFALAAFVAVAQIAGVYGFFSNYVSAAIEGGSATPEQVAASREIASYSVAWLGTYLMAVAAGLVLSIFAAKGAKAWCFALLVLVVPLAPWVFLFVWFR